ncbi:MAG: chemotaxis protein CheR [Rubritepida sp.]|nr:chemotaxis protein CheR [Rubritepida sp.]
MSVSEMSVSGGFPIVGVGASAGGVEALEGFFRGLPAKPGLAVVVVTHLSPDRESLLHEVIARYTAMPVHVAEDRMQVEIDNVYVLPANSIVEIAERQLQVHQIGNRRERKPIDIFFASLAVNLGELSAGVVLSGGDGDGTLGIKAIKERGGLTLAQVADGFGPKHPSMPDSAISTGLVDFAVPADMMGAKLVDFVRSSDNPGGGVPHPIAEGALTIDRGMPEIYGILRSQVGHDFSGYKTTTFFRRVQRRMQVLQLLTIEAYAQRLRQDPREVGALFRDLLINVTSFFRDADAFEALEKLVVPKLFEGRGADDTVRVWVPGCSTGEEVFSLAILLREHMDTLAAVPRVQIFATDIDEHALGVARTARYPAALLDGVTPERRGRFFLPDGGSNIVSKEVRELCIFSPHSVIRDPPFSRIDLVSCRNLLIYFGGGVQNQVIPTFHYALRPDGYLFLGSAENVSQFDDLFAPVDKKQRIFRRRADGPSAPRLPLVLSALRPAQRAELGPRRPSLGDLALRQAVDEQVLDRFAPAHVVVNGDGDVVYYSHRTGKYLETPAGAPTRQFLTMARKGLRLDLRTLFREAVESGRPAVREDIAVENDAGGVQFVNLTVDPLSNRIGAGTTDPLYLVLFTDQGPLLSREEAMHRDHATQGGGAVHPERELRETRERLQSMIEEYETALEELKSSNEELVSVNEEMQSTNEELEASKEELQSVNEELHTVNAELTGKVDALDRANSDLRSLFESTEVATVFLDENLVIRSFTPTVAKVFHVLPGDRGRPITDLSSRLVMPGFADDIARVFADKGPIERRVENEDESAHFLVRLAPYRDVSERIEGVIVTFIDVTIVTRAEARQRVLIAELQHRTRNLLAIIQSIAQQTLGKGGSLASYVTRLQALGRVQSLVGGAMDDRIDLGDIVHLELQAIGPGVENKVSISGPKVSLGFELVQSFGLALHELATNAVKHGALSVESGRLAIAWDLRRNRDHDQTLLLEWRESGVPDLQPPTRRGFGRELIERALAYTLRAETEMVFGEDGMTCRIEMPLPARPVEEQLDA